MSAARVTSRRKAPAGRAIRNRVFFFTIAPTLNLSDRRIQTDEFRPTNSDRRIQTDSDDYTVLKFFVKGLKFRGKGGGNCRGKGGGKGGGKGRGEGQGGGESENPFARLTWGGEWWFGGEALAVSVRGCSAWSRID